MDFHKQTTIPDLEAGKSRPLPFPHKIGPYKIESRLNKGGMSVLYLGIHPDTNQPIVVKVLLPKFLKNKEIVNRFLKEAEIIGLANHPNIVRLYGQGQWEKGLYIAMEFIQGISLRQFIQQKSLSQKKALEIILQVAYALSHLHAHGVIHRDLKPENILITESGEIKVIDFGIAQLSSDLEQGRITQKKRMMGTPVYMSPEQKENPLHLTFASDIYSLGIIAYELILGRLSHGVVHLGLLPLRLRGIIEKALKIDPKERYHDIVDFITDISQYISQYGDKTEEKEEEVLSMIQETRKVLIPHKGPNWPQLEVAVALHEGLSLSGLYLDFFHLPHNRYGIVIAEPLGEGVSLFQCAIFRGMMRMETRHDESSVKILQTLNQVLSRDPIQREFAVSWLILNPGKDQLSFISCKAGQLWHLPEGSETWRALTTPNPGLGADANSVFLETVDNWNVGDTLVIHSSGVAAKGEEWGEFALLSPQPLSEKILQKSAAQKAAVLVSLRRSY